MKLKGHWLRDSTQFGSKNPRSRAWWLAIGAFAISTIMLTSATPYLSSAISGSLTTTTVNACLAEGGFGNGPSAYTARAEGVLSGVTISSTCSGGSLFSSVSLTINAFAGVTNITAVDALRFYWNGTPSATVTFSFSSTGTPFFTSSGPYGYLLINSTTGGTYPVHSNDDCVGATISAPGTGNCKLQVLPLAAGVAGAVAATGTSGNTVTGLVNLSSPSTVICPPAGALWITGSSSCTAGSGGSVKAVLAAGPSFVVLSLGLSDPPQSYPGTDTSFSVTVSATAVW